MLLIIDLAVLILAAVTFCRSGLSFKKLGPLTIFFYLYVIYLCAVFLIIEMYRISGIQVNSLEALIPVDPNYLWNNISTFLSLFLFCFGLYCSKWFVRSYPVRSNEYLLKGELSGFLLMGFGAALVVMLLLLRLYTQFGIPLLSSAMEALRLDMMRAGGYKYILVSYLYVTPALLGAATYTMIQYPEFSREPKMKCLKLFILFLIVLQLSSVLAGFRTYVLVFGYVLLMAYSIRKVLSYRLQFLFIVAGVTFLFGITFLKYGMEIESKAIGFVGAKLAHRLFFDGYYTRLYVQEFVGVYGYQWGYTYLLQLYSLLPGKQMTFQNIIGAFIGTDFALAPTLLGDLWVNFGGLSFLFLWGFGMGSGVWLRKMETYLKYGGKRAIFIAPFYFGCGIFLIRTIEGGLGAFFLLIAVGLISVALLAGYEILPKKGCQTTLGQKNKIFKKRRKLREIHYNNKNLGVLGR